MIIIDGNSLSIDEVVKVSRNPKTVKTAGKSFPGVV